MLGGGEEGGGGRCKGHVPAGGCRGKDGLGAGGRGHWAMTGVEEAGGGKELRDM